MTHRLSRLDRLPGRLLDAQAHMDRAIESIRTCSSRWVGIFVGHPTRLRHKRFWDTPYKGGKTPKTLRPAPLQSQEAYERSLENLSKFLVALGERFEVIGVDEALGLPWNFRPPNSKELAYFRVATERNIRAAAKWSIHKPHLDVSAIVAKAMSMESTLEIGCLGGKQ